jgi:hypothetical protein
MPNKLSLTTLPFTQSKLCPILSSQQSMFYPPQPIQHQKLIIPRIYHPTHHQPVATLALGSRPKQSVATLALGSRLRQRGCKVAGQEETREPRQRGRKGVDQEEARKSHHIFPGMWESVRECEGVNTHTPKATPTLGYGVPVDSRNFRERF